MSLKGIDISNWQSNINLSAINADFIIVKSSEGIGWTDPSFSKLYNAAKNTGKRLGVYHFARPTANNDPVEEANSFLSVIKKQDVIGKAILVLDWEAENKHNTTWAKKWLDRVYSQTGVKPMIYMSESVVNAYDWSAVANAGYTLWVAKYRDNTPDYNYDMSNAGTVPKVKHWKTYKMWQWTSSGRLNGYSGNLDCNEFYGTTSDWDALVGKTVAPTPVKSSYKAPGAYLTPQAWYNMTIGKGYNVDGAYGNQCWDYFAYFIKYFGLGLNTYCATTGYVIDLWNLRDKYNYSKHFTYITDPKKLQNGDWLIWAKGSSCPLSHVGMYWNGQVVGQNQGGLRYVNARTLKLDIAGAFRWKAWETETQKETTDLSKYTDQQLAEMVLQGTFGNGDTRKALLGSRYSAVQKIVNNLVSNKKSNEEIANEVLQGKWGNGDERKKKLTAAGYDYSTIQSLVNNLVKNQTKVNKTLKVGAKVRIKQGALDLNTKRKYASFVYSTNYIVKSMSNNRIVFGTSSVVIGATDKSNIILI